MSTDLSTLITFIKPTKYANLFLIDRISEEHRHILNIKRFNGKNWIYIKDNQITPKKMTLVPNRTYELSEVKVHEWNNFLIKRYLLSQTFETLNYKKCLFTEKN